MSDDEDYDYDYGGFFESEDDLNEDIADHVDSLAEHTLHSPVLVNAQPDFDVEYDEWEYLTDEYWDEEQPPERGASGSAGNTAQLKKRRQASQKLMPVANNGGGTGQKTSLQNPAVIWRTKKKDNAHSMPVLQPGDGNKIALLVDWRAILEEPAIESPRSSSPRSAEAQVKEERKTRSKDLEQSRKSGKKVRKGSMGEDVNGTSSSSSKSTRNLQEKYKEDIADGMHERAAKTTAAKSSKRKRTEDTIDDSSEPVEEKKVKTVSAVSRKRTSRRTIR